MKVIDLVAQRILELAFAAAAVKFDFEIGSYVYSPSGNPVAQSVMLGWQDKYTAVVKGKVEFLTEAFIDGNISMETWQTQMALEIKDGWTTSSVIGRGGRSSMTQADWGRTGGRLNYEYQRLNNFANDINQGLLSDKQIAARAQLYANATRLGYYDGLTSAKIDAGYTHEQRFLNPAEHCDDCVEYAAMGIVIIGTLPEPGEASQCGRNCKCTKVYYTPQDLEEMEATEWRASMTREEADAWAADSVYKESLYHGTSSDGMMQIPQEGFDLDRIATGRAYGSGVYTGTTYNTAAGFTSPNNVLELKANVQNPFIHPGTSFEKVEKDAMNWYSSLPNDKQLAGQYYGNVSTFYLQNLGYDSISIPDFKYFIVFDPKDITVVQ